MEVTYERGRWKKFMIKNEYGYYKCRICGQHKRAWVESECYRESICPKCIDAVEEAVNNYCEDQHDR